MVTAAVKRKTNTCIYGFSSARNRPLAVSAPLLACRSPAKSRHRAEPLIAVVRHEPPRKSRVDPHERTPNTQVRVIEMPIRYPLVANMRFTLTPCNTATWGRVCGIRRCYPHEMTP